MNLPPVKRSALHYAQASHHHARFLQRHGWEIAASYGDVGRERDAVATAAGLVDVSWLGKLECRGDWVASLDAGTVAGAGFYRLVPTQALWIVQPDALPAAHAALESRRAGQKRSHLIDVSSLYASVELVGPHAPDVLCKLSAVQMPVGGYRQAPVAGVHALVIRHERGFQFHFGREFGEYLWECFLDAGEEFGLQPAGLEAIGA